MCVVLFDLQPEGQTGWPKVKGSELNWAAPSVAEWVKYLSRLLFIPSRYHPAALRLGSETDFNRKNRMAVLKRNEHPLRSFA